MISKLFILISLILKISAENMVCKSGTPISVRQSDSHYSSKPYVNGARKFFNGIIEDYHGTIENITSPIIDDSTGERTVIGKLAQMTTDDAINAVNSAAKAWNHGQGQWPQMSLQDRIIAITNVVKELRERRVELANVLMWEICKTVEDALQEIDRTIVFIESTIEAIKAMDSETNWKTINGIYARIRRAAIGIMLCLGPFNYPFNETYAALIPALLAGNVVILKIPTIGGLAHILTMEIYAKHLPPGAINFVSGLGRVTVSPMMKTGKIDILSFIGGTKAADVIIKDHPEPHRLHIFLQLEGKNVGIITPDADITIAVKETIIGSLTFNGQRCTAIKLIMVHKSRIDEFLKLYTQQVNALKVGLPWESGVSITPLPEGQKKINYLQSLIQDAISHGAKIVNHDMGGGDIYGLLMKPAVLYPVDKSMKIYHEEQFGPVVPIATYENNDELIEYFSTTPYGLQTSLFTTNVNTVAPLIDVLSTVVGRININTQCGRSPDSVPFSGRRASALGTMSITEAYRVFSIETVVAGKSNAVNVDIMNQLESKTNFLHPL